MTARGPLLGREPLVARLGVDDPALPGLDAAVDAARVAPLLERAYEARLGVPLRIVSGEVTYVRYKPGTNLRAAYRFLTDGARDVPLVLGYGKLVPPERAAKARAKAEAAAGERLASHVLSLDPLPMVFHLFPFDCEMPGLAVVMNRDRLKRLARATIPWGSPAVRVSGRRTSLSLVRYKPERRAVVIADMGLVDEANGWRDRCQAHVKAYADGAATRAVAAARAIEEAAARGGMPRVARILGYDPALRVLFQERLDAAPFAEAADPAGAARRAGGALAWLHGLPPVAPASGVAEPAVLRTPDTGIDVVANAGRYLARLGASGLADAAADLVSRLRRAVPAPVRPCFLHGDFHHNQVLALGDNVAFVDFDEAGGGDPRMDVGNFVAHLRHERLSAEQNATAARGSAATATSPGSVTTADAAAIPWKAIEQAFLGGYAEAGGSLSGMEWFIAIGLAALAIVPFRALRQEWRGECAAILEAAGAEL